MAITNHKIYAATASAIVHFIVTNHIYTMWIDIEYAIFLPHLVFIQTGSSSVRET